MNNQVLEFVIISFILMTLMFDSGVILLEEVGSLSLLTWTCYFYSSAFVAEIFWLIFFFLPQNLKQDCLTPVFSVLETLQMKFFTLYWLPFN